VKSRTCFKRNGEPRSVYSSLAEAESAADYERCVHGADLVPYLCDSCGEYHNSPKDRVTPSKACPHCIDGNGRRKELYESREAACRRAEIISKEKKRGIKLDVYPCPYKLGYHLTKR